MSDVVDSKKERSSGKLKTPRNCKENSGDEIFRILSERSKQTREIIDSMPQKNTRRLVLKKTVFLRGRVH